jgi:hypothetical protein
MTAPLLGLDGDGARERLRALLRADAAVITTRAKLPARAA